MQYFDFAQLYLLTDKVEIDLNVLGAAMLNWIR